MAIRTRIEPIERDIAVLFADDLSPEARSMQLAAYAREQFDAVQAENTRIIGQTPPHEQFVDGRRDAPLESVKPDGRIVFEFDLINELFAWIGEQLVVHSPVLTGRYQRSHLFFADGVEIAVGAVPPEAREYAFVNAVPYARKIERGLSDQAPDGVYEAVAALASRRFGNVARIRFTYRTIAGSAKDKDTRQPAIVITV